MNNKDASEKIEFEETVQHNIMILNIKSIINANKSNNKFDNKYNKPKSVQLSPIKKSFKQKVKSPLVCKSQVKIRGVENEEQLTKAECEQVKLKKLLNKVLANKSRVESEYLKLANKEEIVNYDKEKKTHLILQKDKNISDAINESKRLSEKFKGMLIK